MTSGSSYIGKRTLMRSVLLSFLTLVTSAWGVTSFSCTYLLMTPAPGQSQFIRIISITGNYASTATLRISWSGQFVLVEGCGMSEDEYIGISDAIE